MADTRVRPEFTYVDTPEPHVDRRKRLLAKYPSIRGLFGYDPWQGLTTMAAWSLHLGIAWFVAYHAANVPTLALASLLVGAVLSHWMAMTIHETSHNLVFRTPAANRALALVANIPMLVPFAMSFHRYHLQHHTHLGVDVADSDLPHPWEVKYIGHRRWAKALWLLFNNVFYTVRGFSFASYPPTRREYANLAFIVCTNILLALWLGGWGLGYLALSTAIGMSFHPVAAHFIHEHYTFHPGQETFSYYGPLNAVTFNVGYHNEHHDFMNVPGSRLPQLHKLGIEEYGALQSTRSWTGVLVDFVFDRRLGLASRIVRTLRTYEQAG